MKRTAAFCCIAAIAAMAAFASAPVASAASRPRIARGPVELRAVLKDANGRPLPGALVQLFVTTKFFGVSREALIDEKRTDAKGVARLTFAPAERGKYKGVVRFSGASIFGPSEQPISFDVRAPAVVWKQAPLGVGGVWARSWVILIPVTAVWMVFAIAAWQLRAVRAAGRRPRFVRLDEESLTPIEGVR